jgi:hypothetical protein
MISMTFMKMGTVELAEGVVLFLLLLLCGL